MIAALALFLVRHSRAADLALALHYRARPRAKRQEAARRGARTKFQKRMEGLLR